MDENQKPSPHQRKNHIEETCITMETNVNQSDDSDILLAPQSYASYDIDNANRLYSSLPFCEDKDPDDENEVFFGDVTEKERKIATKYSKRRTILYNPGFRKDKKLLRNTISEANCRLMEETTDFPLGSSGVNEDRKKHKRRTVKFECSVVDCVDENVLKPEKIISQCENECGCDTELAPLISSDCQIVQDTVISDNSHVSRCVDVESGVSAECKSLPQSSYSSSDEDCKNKMCESENGSQCSRVECVDIVNNAKSEFSSADYLDTVNMVNVPAVTKREKEIQDDQPVIHSVVSDSPVYSMLSLEAALSEVDSMLCSAGILTGEDTVIDTQEIDTDNCENVHEDIGTKLIEEIEKLLDLTADSTAGKHSSDSPVGAEGSNETVCSLESFENSIDNCTSTDDGLLVEKHDELNIFCDKLLSGSTTSDCSSSDPDSSRGDPRSDVGDSACNITSGSSAHHVTISCTSQVSVSGHNSSEKIQDDRYASGVEHVVEASAEEKSSDTVSTNLRLSEDMCNDTNDEAVDDTSKNCITDNPVPVPENSAPHGTLTRLPLQQDTDNKTDTDNDDDESEDDDYNACFNADDSQVFKLKSLADTFYFDGEFFSINEFYSTSALSSRSVSRDRSRKPQPASDQTLNSPDVTVPSASPFNGTPVNSSNRFGNIQTAANSADDSMSPLGFTPYIPMSFNINSSTYQHLERQLQQQQDVSTRPNPVSAHSANREHVENVVTDLNDSLYRVPDVEFTNAHPDLKASGDHRNGSESMIRTPQTGALDSDGPEDEEDKENCPPVRLTSTFSNPTTLYIPGSNINTDGIYETTNSYYIEESPSPVVMATETVCRNKEDSMSPFNQKSHTSFSTPCPQTHADGVNFDTTTVTCGEIKLSFQSGNHGDDIPADRTPSAGSSQSSTPQFSGTPETPSTLAAKRAYLQQVKAEKEKLEQKIRSKATKNVHKSPVSAQRFQPLKSSVKYTEPTLKHQPSAMNSCDLDTITVVNTLCNSQQMTPHATNRVNPTIVRHMTPKSASKLQWKQEVVNKVTSHSSPSKVKPLGKSILNKKSAFGKSPQSPRHTSPIVISRTKRTNTLRSTE